MNKDPFLQAFAPINIITTGGFLAVTYFKNRAATGDLDYQIDPEWIKDEEIKAPLQAAIISVADKEHMEDDWMNDSLAIFATNTAWKTIFQQAYKQNIKLFVGKSLIVWAAPFEWALERKLRRVAFSSVERESKNVDMEDALALFKHFREANRGPLDMEYFRKLNMNSFDPEPTSTDMGRVAAEYEKRYGEALFSPAAEVASNASTSYQSG